ncbi:uncharacterized protein TrAtP1_000209 [Trichoderma atroviride]|uniref:uncharacterized protein n=1 Tax=Hypocrea atroviridis TaxID=63577 RepID=UPI0033317E0F|nr:hypothetical protein TrAtP1_000209 [Trichoderma atroviride]
MKLDLIQQTFECKLQHYKEKCQTTSSSGSLSNSSSSDVFRTQWQCISKITRPIVNHAHWMNMPLFSQTFCYQSVSMALAEAPSAACAAYCPKEKKFSGR